MSLPIFNPIEDYLGAGNLQQYSFDFKITDPSQLLVKVVDTTNTPVASVRGTDQTVLLSSIVFDPVNGGGLINLLAPLPTNYRMVILQANDAPTQPSRFQGKFDFAMGRVEAAFDFIASAVQRISYLSNLTIKLSDFEDPTFDPQFPAGIKGLSQVVPTTKVDGSGWDTPTNWLSKPDIDAAAAAAVAAAASAQASANSAFNSASSATAATGSNQAAITAANAAAASATAAGTAAGQATTAAGQAQTAATAASNSATAASTSATNAQTYATNANTSATNAASSASQAGTSATAAQAAATSAAQYAIRAGIVSVPNATEVMSVTYSSAHPAGANTVPVVTVINTLDATPINLTPRVTAYNANGFTVDLGAPTDTANYKLSYQASGTV